MVPDAPAAPPAASRRVLVDANVLLDVLEDDPDWLRPTELGRRFTNDVVELFLA